MPARAHLLICLLPLALAGPACAVGISAGRFAGTFDRSLTASGPLELEVSSWYGHLRARPGPCCAVQVLLRVRLRRGPWAALVRGSPADRLGAIYRNPPILHDGKLFDVGPQRWNHCLNVISLSYDR